MLSPEELAKLTPEERAVVREVDKELNPPPKERHASGVATIKDSLSGDLRKQLTANPAYKPEEVEPRVAAADKEFDNQVIRLALAGHRAKGKWTPEGQKADGSLGGMLKDVIGYIVSFLPGGESIWNFISKHMPDQVSGWMDSITDSIQAASDPNEQHKATVSGIVRGMASQPIMYDGMPIQLTQRQLDPVYHQLMQRGNFAASDPIVLANAQPSAPTSPTAPYPGARPGEQVPPPGQTPPGAPAGVRGAGTGVAPT